MKKLRLLMIGIAAGLAGWLGDITFLASRACAASNPANKLILQVEKEVHDVLPRKSEKRFDEIGWAKDIRDAERLAKQHHRPIFLFTHDERINTGRC